MDTMGKQLLTRTTFTLDQTGSTLGAIIWIVSLIDLIASEEPLMSSRR